MEEMPVNTKLIKAKEPPDPSRDIMDYPDNAFDRGIRSLCEWGFVPVSTKKDDKHRFFYWYNSHRKGQTISLVDGPQGPIVDMHETYPDHSFKTRLFATKHIHLNSQMMKQDLNALYGKDILK